MEPLYIKIQFQSDFMVSTGYGLAGIIDNTIVKCENNIPYIPGTNIKGNIRHSCEEIARMLNKKFPEKDNPLKDSESEIAKIFGTPFTPAGITFESAYPSNVYNLDYFANHFVNVEKHNQIDLLTGTALENHFFSHESCTKNIEFEFCINESFDMETTLTDSEKALLVAGIFFTVRIGGKKSRGRGKCELSLINDTWEAKTKEDWIELL